MSTDCAECPMSCVSFAVAIARSRKLKSATQIAFRWSRSCNVQRATCSRQHGRIRRVVDNWFVFMWAVRPRLHTWIPKPVSQSGQSGLCGQCQQDLPQSDTLVRPCKMPFDCDLKTLTWWPFKFHGQHERPKIQVNFPRIKLWNCVVSNADLIENKHQSYSRVCLSYYAYCILCCILCGCLKISIPLKLFVK